MARAPADGQLDLGSAETGLAVLIEACEKAVEDRGESIPSAQMRALLTIDQAGSLNLSRLAEALGASASAASRLCDRMQAHGLLTRDRAAASRREIVLLPTESGRMLAEWVRSRRRAALRDVMQAMSPDGRAALVQGLRELAAG
jgi:DNA-binding MarR family transcriptional regulator